MKTPDASARHREVKRQYGKQRERLNPTTLTLQEYLDGIETLQKTEGWRIHEEIQRLGRSFYIFRANYEELTKTLFLDYAQFLILFDVRNDKQMKEFLIEVTRRLHNFVAGAKTLVDHTRNVATELYETTPFWTVYQSELNNRFTSSPVIQFVHCLRNYTLHKDLPLASASLSSRFETSIRIDLSTLQEWNGLNAAAREYVKISGDEYKVEDIARSYYEAVSEFHEWFFENQKRLHQTEFAETNALRERLVNSKWHSKWP